MEKEKKRHGCLTAWLVLLIIFSSLTILSYSLYLFGSGMFVRILQNPQYVSQIPESSLLQLRNLLNTPIWVFVVFIMFTVFNIACVVALFMWKKWGFWGYFASSALALTINLIYFRSGILTTVISISASILAVLILFGVLQIGGKNKGWPQLR